MAAVLSSDRLEVSVDGLTLSPNAEELPCEARPGPGDALAGRPAPALRRCGGSAEDFEIFFFSSTEKDGKAFHPTYEEKLKLVALHKQVLLGPYNPDTCPEVGFFDVLGNDRRKEWAALGNMSKQEAMTEFVKLLNRCCHLFSTYVTSHKIEKEEQEKKR
uniref:ACB domain-containing protein n=1 Tax=Apteryx owenii TaxID=8824 RepID=A0A8B9QBR6_APTOW